MNRLKLEIFSNKADDFPLDTHIFNENRAHGSISRFKPYSGSFPKETL